MTEVVCPVSGNPMMPVFTETLLGKHRVTYYYSPESGLLKTESPYWLAEAYQDAIATTDVGILVRNEGNRDTLAPLLYHLFRGKGRFVDTGGGYGILTRMLRDIGIDCYSTDKYCDNLFAKTFEPTPGFKADALFAFEVLEHIEDPLGHIRELFDRYSCKTLIFSTLTFKDDIPPASWWYYSFATGQHITFYQPRTLDMIAEKLGVRYHAISPSLHLFTDTRLSKTGLSLRFRHLKRVYESYVRMRRRKESRTWDDHLLMVGRMTNG